MEYAHVLQRKRRLAEIALKAVDTEYRKSLWEKADCMILIISSSMKKRQHVLQVSKWCSTPEGAEAKQIKKAINGSFRPTGQQFSCRTLLLPTMVVVPDLR